MKRFILDMTLLGLILLVMGFHLLPGLAHEIGGLILLAGAGWHLTLNRRWFGSLFRERWSGLRLMQTALGLLLVIAFLPPPSPAASFPPGSFGSCGSGCRFIAVRSSMGFIPPALT